MKKLIFTLIALTAIHFVNAQTTYYWVGGTSPAAGGWSTGANWNTALDGSGTTRTAATNDILIFDGTNVGGSTPATGAVSVSLTSQTIGKLVLQNGADVALSRNGSGGTSTLTIGDNPSGHDLVVFAGCTLRLKGVTGSILLLLANDAGSNNIPPATTSATAMIYGDIVLEQGDNTYQNRFTSRMKNAFTFASGSSLRALAAYAFYPFGTSGSGTTPINEGVVFESGSSYYYEGGLSPFGSNSTSFLTKFQPGSKFYFRAAPAANMFGSRSYGDVVVENNSTVTANGSLIRIDSFRVETGSTFITNVSGVTPIHGDVVINGTFRVPTADPDRNNKIVFAGSAPQSIKGTGTITLADIVVSNISDVTLQKSIQLDSLLYVVGHFTGTGYNVTGAPVVTIKTPASLNITGNMNVDSFIVKNISDLTNIEIGMSVTGTGVPANTVVTSTSTSSNTITLSKAVTGSVTYAGAAVALNVFNNQGVLPVRFGTFTAALQGARVNLNWEVLTEQDIISYSVERSTNGTEFASIGIVKANSLKAYSFTDQNALSGISYYRIKSIGVNGEVKYTSIAKIVTTKTKAEVLVSPNPVSGKRLTLNLSGLNKANYTMTIVNAAGQKVFTYSLGTIDGSASAAIQLPGNIQPGVYSLIVHGNNQPLQRTIIVQ